MPQWPALTLAEANGRLMAPGRLFEVEEIQRGPGVSVRTWKHGPKTLVDVWCATEAYGSRPFIYAGDLSTDYDGFRRASFAFACALRRQGVGVGDRVAVAMSNCPEWVVVFFGAALAGAIVTPLDARWSADELLPALVSAAPKTVVLDKDCFARIAAGLTVGARHLRGFIRNLDDATDAPRAWQALETVLGPRSGWSRLPSAGMPPVVVGPHDDATLFFTSGSTGTPKGVLADHRAATTSVYASLFSRARTLLRRGVTPPAPSLDHPQKVFLLSLPMSHVAGCFSSLNVAMWIGAALVIMPKWSPKLALSLIEAKRATSLGGVPSMVLQLLEHPEFADFDLSSVDAVTIGGGPAVPGLVAQIAEAFPNAQIGTGWGMTETCSTFTHHAGEDYLMRPWSCGPPVPVGDMKVVDGGGIQLPPGAVGELLVRGPQVASGYWKNAGPIVDADGWLRTGDIARIDDEGFCQIVDRAKDVIIRGGDNVYSIEVEQILCRHPAVADAAVVRLNDRLMGEAVGAWVQMRPGGRASEEELKAHTAAHLASFKVPERILEYDGPLPRNSNGKLLKVTLGILLAERMAPSES